MREIKFRAWDKNEKDMFYEFYMRAWDGKAIQYDYTGKEFDLSTDLILMQFTGLKDKYKMDIYEGDILKHQAGLYEVIFKNGAWCGNPIKNFSLGCLATTRIYTSVKNKQFEVIGNIYANPEFLKEVV